MNKESFNELHGIWRIIPSMVLTEIISQSKFDFQILDCEHGSYDFQTLEQDIRICQNQKCLAYVRVGGLNKIEVQRCLDLGADGIVFPQLNKFEDLYETELVILDKGSMNSSKVRIIEFSENYFSTDLSTSGNLDKNNW